jgi:large subunit ribosomal protein L29
MKAAKWRDLSDDEIRQRARELSEEVFNLRFQLSMGMAKNPARVGQARRDLARAQTILHERGVAGAVVPALAPARAQAAPRPAKRGRSRDGATPARRRRPAKKG